MITQEQLKQEVHYDQETGIFTWLKTHKYSNKKIGDVCGGIDSEYVRMAINGKRYHAHQLAWLYIYGEYHLDAIDHINGIKKDNRICNLRKASVSENAYNRKMSVRNTSGVKGVTWHKGSKKWQVVITYNRIHKYLGMYTDLNKAKEVIEHYRNIYHKEFANTGN